MKKVIYVFLALFALGCNPDRRSSEREGSGVEQQAPIGPAESDTSSIHSDTTTSGGMNRQNQYDTLK